LRLRDVRGEGGCQERSGNDGLDGLLHKISFQSRDDDSGGNSLLQNFDIRDMAFEAKKTPIK
jgi:hypothetical protein